MSSGFVIAVGTAALLMMAVFIIVFVAYYQQKQVRQQLVLKEIQEQHRRELMAATFRGQEGERRRLAEDLHDSIGTMLSVTKMNLNQIERFSTDNNVRLSLQIQKTRAILDETMFNVRRISRDLVPTTLERFGLLAALEELADRATNDDLQVQIDCPFITEPWPSSLNLTLYRIAQELINNAIRHARAQQIVVQLYCFDNDVRLSVMDDGVGFDFDAIMENKQRGIGLRNVESRLSVMNGHVTVDAAPGRGTKVHAQVSLQNLQPALIPS
ncbi:sensor histidine kinase [Spirosoma pomorum]|jgi:signal transduction histidine kinase